MGKKYLETKKDSLESSILGVWKTAIDEADSRMDGRTKGYRDHRAKLEANRQRREAKKVNKEEVELKEAQPNFLRITFKKQTEVKKAMKVADTDFGRGYFMLDPARTRPELDIEGDKDDLENLKDSLKKAGIQFEIEMEEEAHLPEAAVNPKDRDELDDDAKDSAKKMKRAQEPAPGQMTEGTKEEYQKFFNAAMKKFKINSPADLKSDEEKKKFYDYVDKNYKGEKDEEMIQLAKEFKISSMREALRKVWSFDEGELPPALKKAIDAKKKNEDHDDEEENKKKAKTETGKKPAVIDLKPKIKD